MNPSHSIFLEMGARLWGQSHITPTLRFGSSSCVTQAAHATPPCLMIHSGLVRHKRSADGSEQEQVCKHGSKGRSSPVTVAPIDVDP